MTHSAAPPRKEKQKRRTPLNVEKLLGPILGWDDWTATVMAVFTRVALLVKEERLVPPVEVNFTSGNDELLVSYRVDPDPKTWLKPNILDSDQFKWHTDTTFPVRAVVMDRNGDGFEVTVPSGNERTN